MDTSLIKMLRAVGVVVAAVGILIIISSVVKIVPVLGVSQGLIFGGLGGIFTAVGIIMTVYAVRKLKAAQEEGDGQ